MLLRLLSDLLSPPTCAACGSAVAGARIFCAGCSFSVERCSPGGECLAYGHFGGALATAIRLLKYEDHPHLARPLGALLRQLGREQGLNVDLVLPVPLHPRRLAERGYNQSALLARHLGVELHAPLVTNVLARVVDTLAQAELSRAARRANVDQAFRVTRPQQIERRIVALVDDVVTTGATLSACRRVLIDAGASHVVCVVVARTVMSGEQ